MKLQHYLSLSVCVAEIISYAGVLIGWTSLYPVLVREGYFASRCSGATNSSGSVEQSEPCPEQQEQLNLVYTISTSSAPIISLLNGIMLDRAGGWTARTVVITMVCAGNLMTGLSSSDTSWLLYVSFPLINIGGYGYGIVALSMSALFPRMKASVASLISGSFDSAAIVYLLIGKLYRSGVSFATLFLVYSCGTALHHVTTFTLTPRHATPSDGEELETFEYGLRELPCLRNGSGVRNQRRQSKRKMIGGDEGEEEAGTLMSHVSKRYTWSSMAHYCVMHFTLCFFVGSFHTWCDSDELYTTTFGIVQFLGVLFSLLAGVLNDFLRRRLGGTPRANMRAVAYVMLTGDVMIVSMLALALTPYKNLHMVALVLQVIGRSFVYSSSAAFVSVCYPTPHLGVLYSLMQCLGGLVLLLQYPLTLLLTRVLDSDLTWIYASLILLGTGALLHPLYLLRFSARAFVK